jgi:DNA-binding response OmpR family regulator/tRNA A-37 threonylcarbamoyl transferase component Bud32
VAFRGGPSLDGSATILVVDDNAINRELLVEELTYRGFVVRAVGGGEEALERLALASFDLVLLDVMMPVVDGLTVLRRIRETRSPVELPVIMTTARVDRHDIVQALELGANDYVTKPIDLPVLLARVRTQLALARASRELRAAQQKILELTASASSAHHDVDAWATTTAAELTELLNARVDVRLGTRIDETTVHATKPVAVPEPEDDVDAAHFPIHAAGREAGEVIVRRLALSRDERILIESFATQLGAAVEMRELRNELTAARERQLDRAGGELLRVCGRCGACYAQSLDECPEDGWPLAGAQLVPMRIANRYRLRRRIAVGSTARVFAADDERLGRPVVIKIIKSEFFNDAEIRARFEQEARAAARIDHPNVGTIFDSGAIDDGSLFFVMEHLRGLDLAEMIKLHGRGSPAQVAALVRQLGAALSAVHAAGFIHRDIKPSNIFLVEERDGFRAKILDFGIAKSVDGDATLTRHGGFVGTPAYMAPEQIDRQSRLDARTDLYALATVVYEALAGKRVTTEREVSKVFHEILHTPPPSIGDAALDAELARALAKRADERPQSVAEWSERVAALLERMPAAQGWPDHFWSAAAMPPL